MQYRQAAQGKGISGRNIVLRIFFGTKEYGIERRKEFRVKELRLDETWNWI